MKGYICGPFIYTYKGVMFEFRQYSTQPWPLKKDGEPRLRAGKKFYDLFDEWFRLPEKERESYRVGGGCINV